MQRNRKMTLNEEFALMRKMFHKMGVTEVLKENKIRLNESLGGPTPTVFDGFTPGSSVAIIGKTVLPEIESAILMSAKNSEYIMQTLGKRVGDNLTFDDIVNSGLMGATKREVAQNIVTQLGEGGVTLMKNLGDILGGANSTSLKNQIAELSNEPQRQVQSKLQNIQKQIDVPDQATKAANLETVADLLPGLRNAVDSDISLTATQKTAINELFDSLEAQANAYKTKSSTNLVTPTSELTPTTFRDLSLGVLSDSPTLSKYMSEATDTQISIVKNMLTNVTDDAADEVLDNIVNGFKRDTSITLYSGPGKIISDIFEFIPRYLKRWSGKGTSPAGGCLQMIFVLFLVIGAIFILKKCSDWDGKVGIPDLNPFNDSDDMKCVKEVPGFGELIGDEQSWAAQKYGCKRTKNDNTDQKVIAFSREDGKVLVKTKDNCIISYEVIQGGLSETEISNSCSGNNEDEDPNPDPNPGKCTCTQSDLEKSITDSGVEFKDASFNSSNCTLTYTQTKIDGKELENPTETTISCEDIGK